MTPAIDIRGVMENVEVMQWTHDGAAMRMVLFCYTDEIRYGTDFAFSIECNGP